MGKQITLDEMIKECEDEQANKEAGNIPATKTREGGKTEVLPS